MGQGFSRMLKTISPDVTMLSTQQESQNNSNINV